MKSQSTFYVDLLEKIMIDTNPYVKFSVLERDIAYLRRRVRCEGLSFLTKVLPSFGKVVLRSLEAGRFTGFANFGRQRQSLLPEFLGGWTKRIFAKSGEVLPDPDPYALQELLQVTSLFYKLSLPYSHEQEKTVLDAFRKAEGDIAAIEDVLEIRFHGCETEQIDRGSCSVEALARTLIHRVLDGYNPKDIKPRHGPGGVATRERGNEKWRFQRKYQRLHEYYPYYRYFAPSLSMVAFESGWYRRLTPEINPLAKVVLVPKDSRGPRLISMEPLEVQWIQQGQLRKLAPWLERHPLTRGKINFSNQSPNQIAAKSASVDKAYATLDLKEASDRVSLTLFRNLFPKEVVEAWEACRSVATVMPNGDLFPLRKFAPMGSALCFPVMAMTIWALAEASLRLKGLNTDGLLIYGDDLIIPTEGYESVVRTLHSFGLQVNTDKSFKDSHFRESCGMDAFLGVQVTPTRMKAVFTHDHLDHRLYAGLLQLSEAFYERGCWGTVRFLRDTLYRIYGKVPWTHDNSFPGYYCPDIRICNERNHELGFTHRHNPELQRDELLVRTVKGKTGESPVTSHWRLHKGLMGLYRDSSEHHRVSLRHKAVLRKRWCAA